MKNFTWVGAIALALLTTPCSAQNASSVQAPAGFAPMSAPCVKQADKSCLPVSLTAPMPVTSVVQTVAADRGALVGTTAVTLFPANPARRGWSIQVQSTSASCYVNGTSTATADYHSLQVGPGGFFEPDHHVGTSAISVVCTGSATPVYAREW